MVQVKFYSTADIKMWKTSVVIFAVLSVILAKQIPSYIKLCSLSDPKFEECMIKHGQEAIPKFIKGDREYNVPNLQPLLLDKVEFNAGTLKILFHNMVVSGLGTAKVVRAGFVPEEQKLFFDLLIPRVDIAAQYRTRGRILLLPFEGEGPVNIVLYDGEYNCSAYFNNLTPDSKKPMTFKKSDVRFYAQKSEYHFENLFNGNKQLGDNINQVLNENHESLNVEFNGVFAQTINTVVKSIVTGVTDNIYYKDIFLP